MTSLEIDLLINAAQGANSLKDVRSKLKEIKSAMLEVGDDSAEFNRLAQAAAQLGDRVDDVNQRLKSFNPDGFAALTNFAGKAAGAINVAAGAMALFGDQSEDVQKALMKVQGALALSQGLDAVKGLGAAYKDLNATIKATLFVETAGKQANALATLEQAAAEKILAEAKGGQADATAVATVAQKGLNAAMKANPLGLVIVAITALVAVFYTLNEVMGGASDETIRLNKELEKQKKLTEQLKASTENEIIVLEAMGNQEGKIYEIKRKLMAQEIVDLERAAETHKSKLRDIQDNDSLYESLAKLTGHEDLAAANKAERAQEEMKLMQEEAATIANLKAQLTALDITEENRIFDATEERLQAEQEALEKQNKNKTENASGAADEQKRINQELWDDTMRIIQEQEAAADAQVLYDAERLATREANHKKYVDEKHKREQEAHDKQKKLHEAEEAASRALTMARLEGLSNVFGSLSQLTDANADQQKAFALAEIATQTGIGFVNGLVVAQKAAAGTGPAAAVAFPIFYATQIAAVLAAAAKARSIINSKSGGGGSPSTGGGGSGAFGGVQALNTEPAQPQQPTTQLQQNQNPTSTTTTQDPIRVYVLEQDITQTQNLVSTAQASVAFR